MAKPCGPVCNLACGYCFYRPKEALYPGASYRMSRAVLTRFIEETLAAHPQDGEVVFAWQGGEPTLMGLDFFEEAVAMINDRRSSQQRVAHTLQTNGTQLDAAWCQFLAKHHFLVGLSLDGPQVLHDTYRVDMRRRGTFDRVRAAYDELVHHGVDVNLLCAVHAANADCPLDVYRFFRDDLAARYLQFIPIVEREEEPRRSLEESASVHPGPVESPVRAHAHPRSVTPGQFGRFLTEIFDEWVRRDVGRVFVQLFDATLANFAGEPSSLCVTSETCGTALALEFNGDVYSCDHYVDAEHRLGNLQQQRLPAMIDSSEQQRFGRSKRDSLPRQCRDCSVRFACHGGCPKDRFATTSDGEAGLNFLCAGYRHFYQHVTDAMRFMASELRSGRSPANVMREMGRRDTQKRLLALTQGGPCACGSGLSFPECHGRR